MFFKKLIVFGALTTLVFSSINAANCGPSGKSVRILGSDFPAIHAVAGTAKDNCAGNANVFTVTHKDDTRQIMNAALTPNPAEYTSVIVANSTLTQLMNDGLVRPLNDLVKKYGSHLKPHQMITIDGDVMAVAFMANSQHLFTRKDILSAAGVQGTPASIEEVLDAAKKIRAAGIMEYPIVTNLKVGWNVGEVFNLFYMAQGGQHFKSGSAEPNINNQTGLKTLEIMKGIASYAHPDHLTQASNETQGLWEAGKAAIGIMWGSRGGVILDDEGSTAKVTSNTLLSAAPSVGGGSTPAATLWWDGITIAKNIPDDDAEATFAALVSAMTPSMVAKHNDKAVWLIDGFKPGPAAAGVSATAAGGAPSYPMIPYIGLMHNALGAELVDYLKGAESAQQALKDVEAAYVTAAKEAGYLK